MTEKGGSWSVVIIRIKKFFVIVWVLYGGGASLVTGGDCELLSFFCGLVEVTNSCTSFISFLEWVHKFELLFIGWSVLCACVIDDLFIKLFFVILKRVLMLAFVFQL